MGLKKYVIELVIIYKILKMTQRAKSERRKASIIIDGHASNFYLSPYMKKCKEINEQQQVKNYDSGFNTTQVK